MMPVSIFFAICHTAVVVENILLRCLSVWCAQYSKVTGLPVVRRKNPLQFRRSQGYLIANAHRIPYPPGGPDHVLDLSASVRSTVLASAGAVFPPPAPAGLQLALSAPPRLRRAGQPPRIGPAWPSTSGLSALPPALVCGLLVHQDAALVVRRPSPAGLSSTGRWHLVSGRR